MAFIKDNNIIYIYSLTDPNTGTVGYIGKTNNPKNRLSCHLRDAKSKKYRTYKNSWIISLIKQNCRPIMNILEICSNSNWEEREKHWIKEYKNLGYKLVNFEEGGLGDRKSLKKRTTALKIKYSKPVEMYTKNWEYITQFNSASEACKYLGKSNKSCIINAANGHADSVYEYKWKYVGEIRINKRKEKLHLKNRIIIQFDDKMNFINKFNSLDEAVQSNDNLVRKYIIHCCNKRQNTYNGYIWRYENREVPDRPKKNKCKKVGMFTVEGEKINEFRSVREVERTLGYKHCAISNCCSNRQHTSYGYIWKYL